MKNIAIKLTWANIAHRPLNSILTIATLAAAVALLSLLLQTQGYADKRIQKDLAGVDLVVGAKGSPVQLILSSLLHLDIPTGNIPLLEAQSLMRDPQVRRAVPLALGDSFRSFRIVGTTSDFLDLYQAEVSSGLTWQGPQEVVIGAEVSRALNMQVGQRFVGGHGLSSTGADLAEHAHAPYRVTGILEPTGSILDRLILTSVESVWHAHGQTVSDEHSNKDHNHTNEHGHADEHASEHASEHEHSTESKDQLTDITSIAPEGKEVTALLLQYASPIAAVRLPRMINSKPGLQAAAPAMEITRLISLSSGFTSAGKVVSALFAIIGGLSIFAAVSNATAAKRYNVALMRAMGARPGFIFTQQVLEGILIATVSALAGILVAHFALFSAQYVYAPLKAFGLDGGSFFISELHLLIGTMVLGAIAALWPAVSCFRIDPALLLQRGR